MPAIQYQAFFQNEGGTGWREGGHATDRSGSGKLLQAIQIRLTDLIPAFIVTYDVRFADASWQGTVSGDTLRGDLGNPTRFIDGICIDLVNRPLVFLNGSVSYRVKWANEPGVWSDYKQDGASLGRRGVGIVAFELKVN